MDGRQLPWSVEAERAVLGGLLLEPERLDDVLERMSPADLYRDDHRALLELLREMAGAAEPIDLVTVPERMSRGGQDQRYGGIGYVLQLTDDLPSTANLRHYADVIHEKAVRRRVIEAAHKAVEEAYKEAEDAATLVEKAGGFLAEITETEARRSWEPVSLIVDAELQRIEEVSNRTGDVTGLPTGFEKLDEMLAGLHPTDLVILAARPAMGKTALVLNLALNAAKLAGAGVGVFSLEMGRGQLVTRLLCNLGRVEAGSVRTGRLTNDEWERLLGASERLRQLPIHIDDTPGVSIGDVRTRARRLKQAQPHLELIIIDYLQLMQGEDPRASRQQQISDISRGLKILAKELKVCVLALSQLNRDVEKRKDDKRPMVSDLRESGAIEQDADVIMFIYRDEVYHKDSAEKGVAEVIIGKQRNGPIGMVKLGFQGQFARFKDLEFDDDD